jgi:hypothetical protein
MRHPSFAFTCLPPQLISPDLRLSCSYPLPHRLGRVRLHSLPPSGEAWLFLNLARPQAHANCQQRGRDREVQELQVCARPRMPPQTCTMHTHENAGVRGRALCRSMCKHNGGGAGVGIEAGDDSAGGERAGDRAAHSVSAETTTHSQALKSSLHTHKCPPHTSAEIIPPLAETNLSPLHPSPRLSLGSPPTHGPDNSRIRNIHGWLVTASCCQISEPQAGVHRPVWVGAYSQQFSPFLSHWSY